MLAAIVVSYIAITAGIFVWLDRNPLVIIESFGILIGLTVAAKFTVADDLFMARWNWRTFTQTYPSRGSALEGSLADGFGIVGNRYLPLKAAVTGQGILLESSTLEHLRAMVPWADISRIARATITVLAGNPCKPYMVAHLYISRASDGEAIIPWRDEFDASVPQQVGLTRLNEDRAL